MKILEIKATKPIEMKLYLKDVGIFNDKYDDDEVYDDSDDNDDDNDGDDKQIERSVSHLLFSR